MKIILGLFFVFVLAVMSFAQTVKSLPGTTRKADAKDIELLSQLQAAKIAMFDCYEQYYKDNTPENRQSKVKVLNACRDLRSIELGDVYSEISKRPSAIKIMLGNELSENNSSSISISQPRVYSESSKSEISLRRLETTSDSQVDLQRIIVVQNQRIIELLEKLLNKK